MKPEKIMRVDDGEILEKNDNATYSFVNSNMYNPYSWSYEELINIHKGKFIALWDGEPKKNINLEGMVDVYGGRTRLGRVTEEIRHYFHQYRKLKHMVVDINENEDGYHATIYIPVKDFEYEESIAGPIKQLPFK